MCMAGFDDDDVCILPLPSRKDEIHEWIYVHVYFHETKYTHFALLQSVPYLHLIIYERNVAIASITWNLLIVRDHQLVFRYLWSNKERHNEEEENKKHRNENENNKMCNRNCEFQKIQCKHTHTHHVCISTHHWVNRLKRIFDWIDQMQTNELMQFKRADMQ